jgi:hypothetical protein
VNASSTFSFQWLSPLGISVALFLLYGAWHVLVGIFFPIYGRTGGSFKALITSERADMVVFGKPPAILLREDSALATVRQSMADWQSGLWFCFGIFQIALARFALRQGQRWAIWTLTLADLGMIPFVGLYLQPILRASAPWGLFDPPPILMTAVLVMPIAVLLGWIGLR